jgi:hypothetical protein
VTIRINANEWGRSHHRRAGSTGRLTSVRLRRYHRLTYNHAIGAIVVNDGGRVLLPWRHLPEPSRGKLSSLSCFGVRFVPSGQSRQKKDFYLIIPKYMEAFLMTIGSRRKKAHVNTNPFHTITMWSLQKTCNKERGRAVCGYPCLVQPI